MNELGQRRLDCVQASLSCPQHVAFEAAASTPRPAAERAPSSTRHASLAIFTTPATGVHNSFTTLCHIGCGVREKRRT
jgi:hypothetical protein